MLPTRLSTTHLVVLFAFVSWLGEVVHNFVDLPQLTVRSPENSIPALVSAVLVMAWSLLHSKQFPTLALLIWALMHLIVGGLLSVMPFPFWPFFPAQTLLHYGMHGIYMLAQLPLILLLVGQLGQAMKKRRQAAAQI